MTSCISSLCTRLNDFIPTTSRANAMVEYAATWTPDTINKDSRTPFVVSWLTSRVIRIVAIPVALIEAVAKLALRVLSYVPLINRLPFITWDTDCTVQTTALSTIKKAFFTYKAPTTNTP